MSFIKESQRSYLRTPLNEEDILNLRCGDIVFINGYVYTLRDASAKMMKSVTLSINFVGELIYFCGPIIQGNNVISCGPTTSHRMEFIIPDLISLGVKGFLGKGPLSREIIEELSRNRVIYFLCCGGAGAYLARKIKNVEIVGFKSLESQAIFKFLLEDFPAVVTNDIYGNDIFSYRYR